MPPIRLRVEGAELYTPDGEHLTLVGMNFYLEWYIKYGATAVHDVRNLRQTIPAANLVRFVALNWHDSHGSSDGLECSTDDESRGYLSPHCFHAMEAAVRQITDAGLWVIVTARAKYAAGYTWPNDPDVFHSAELKRKFYAMWRYVVSHLSNIDRIAGYEIMSGMLYASPSSLHT